MKLHVFPASPNAKKAMFVNAHLGGMAAQEIVNLPEGAHRQEAYLGLNPNGKVPTLEYDDGSTLWESNAIINSMAAREKSDLWPASDQRYDILRWQFWEASHWTPACAKFLAKHIFHQEIDEAEAAETFHRFAGVLDTHLDGRDWLSGGGLSTADISVAMVLCYRDACHYPMDGYGNIGDWVARIEAMPAFAAATPERQAA